MSSDIDHREQLIRDELKPAKLSRRGFVDRIKALGLGFGAAVMLGAEGAEARSPEISLKSTNPALDSIIDEGRKDVNMAEKGESYIRTAYLRAFRRVGYGSGYRRAFARAFRRF